MVHLLRSAALLALLLALPGAQGCITGKLYDATIDQIGREPPGLHKGVVSVSAIGNAGAPESARLVVRGRLAPDGLVWEWEVDGAGAVLRSAAAAGDPPRSSWRQTITVPAGTVYLAADSEAECLDPRAAPGVESVMLVPEVVTRVAVIEQFDADETLTLRLHIPPPEGRPCARERDADGGPATFLLEPTTRVVVLPKPARTKERLQRGSANVGRVLAFIIAAPVTLVLDIVTLPVQLIMNDRTYKQF